MRLLSPKPSGAARAAPDDIPGTHSAADPARPRAPVNPRRPVVQGIATAARRPPAASVPGQRRLPVIGVALPLARDPFGFCMRAAAAGDGLARLDVGPVSAYIASDPDYIHRILVTNASNYGKGKMLDGIRVALGDGLFTSDGEKWKRQRRLLQPAFHARQVERMWPHIDHAVQAALERWRPAIEVGRPIDLLAELIQVNIETILGVLFGTSVDATRTSRLRDLTHEVFRGMTERVWTFFLPPWMPTPGMRRYRRAIAALDEEITTVIAARRAQGVRDQDLLDALLSAIDPDSGTKMTDQEVRDEIFTLFIAGYESTATGTSWTWYLLANNPEAGRNLRAELDSALADRGPTYADLGSLTYTRMVVDEAFRLYPAFPMYFRTSVEQDHLGPYVIPAGARIIVSPYATHRDPRFWEGPETFNPERFRPGRFDAHRRRAYAPFGSGQRLCIGRPLSLAIAQALVATLAQRFESELAPGHIVKPHYAMTYQPQGLRMVLRPRRNASASA
jgi:cytochrome P450